MIFFFSLDVIVIILAMIAIVGAFLGISIGTWLFEHAVIVGIVLLIIHILASLSAIICAFQDYSFTGLICAIIHSLFPPAFILSAYQATLQSGKEFGFGILFEWILVFVCMCVTEFFHFKAIDTTGGRSYFKLISLTLVYILISAFLIALIRTEGF